MLMILALSVEHLKEKIFIFKLCVVAYIILMLFMLIPVSVISDTILTVWEPVMTIFPDTFLRLFGVEEGDTLL